MASKDATLTTINLFGKREVECILHSRLIQEQEIKAASEIELLKAYGSIGAVLEDITILEIFREPNGDLVIYFHTKGTEKIRYYGTDGHVYRFKYGISPDVIKSSLGLGELSIVKATCNELGISQKELADKFGISTSAISQWGADIPKTAQVALELMLENNQLKRDLKTLGEAHKILSRLAVQNLDS